MLNVGSVSKEEARVRSCDFRFGRRPDVGGISLSLHLGRAAVTDDRAEDFRFAPDNGHPLATSAFDRISSGVG